MSNGNTPTVSMSGREVTEGLRPAPVTPVASTTLDHWALGSIQRSVASAPIRWMLWDGFELPSVTSPAVGTIRFKSRVALWSWVWDPELNLGETYMSGSVAIDGSLLALLEAIYRALGPSKRRAWWWMKTLRS